MHYSKDALRKMAQEAAERYLVDSVPMTDTIAKTAASKDLSREQVSRVCAFANHAVNAELMKKQAYVTFEVADPEAIWPKDKEGGFLVVPEPSVKEEETEKIAEGSVLSAFRDLADAYGVDLTVMGDDDQDVRQLLKAADKVSAAAYDDLIKVESALEGEADGLYEEVKKALLSGVPFQRILSDMREDGAMRELEAILPRLEAEYLIPASSYDDDGPYSMQRAYKQADLKQAEKAATGIEWERGTYFKEAAARVEDLIEQARLDAGAMTFCAKIAGIYEDADFAKVAGPYQTMLRNIEKRAAHPVTAMLGTGLKKVIAAPFKAVGKGIKGGWNRIKTHRQAVRNWKDLNSPNYLKDGKGMLDKFMPDGSINPDWARRLGQQKLTEPPKGIIRRVGGFAVDHPAAFGTAAYAGPELVGGLQQVNSAPRLIPM